MLKKPLAFVVASSSDLVFSAANVALACYQHMCTLDYDVVVLYDQISSNDLTALSQIPRCIPRKASFPTGFLDYMLSNLPPYTRFTTPASMMAFSTFEIFALLQEYHTVVWLDNDISIQSDISNLTLSPTMAMPLDGSFMTQVNFTQPIKSFNMHSHGYCSCVIVAHDNLPYSNLHAWCWEKAVEYAPYMLNRDQGIINLLIQAFKLPITTLCPSEWACMPNHANAKQANMVHFGGKEKIWKRSDYRKSFPEWTQRHQQWLSLGGQDYTAIGEPSPKGAKSYKSKKTTPISVICYGTGEIASSLLPALSPNDISIEAFIDDRPGMAGQLWNGIEVIPVEKIHRYKFNFVLIACRPQEKVQKKLHDLGIPPQKIVLLDIQEIFINKRIYWSCLHEEVWNYLGKYLPLRDAIDISTLLDSSWLKKHFTDYRQESLQPLK